MNQGAEKAREGTANEEMKKVNGGELKSVKACTGWGVTTF